MTLAFAIVTYSIKYLTKVLCKVDGSELNKVPFQGPLIVVSNHINFLEVPVLYTHLQPRKMTGFAKAETWKNPALGLLFNLWGAIPIKRGEADAIAIRFALDALNQGKILAIAPEGTRSKNGRLQQGHPGIILLAQKSKAPILPLVYYGGEKIRDNLYRLKRTDFHIRVGKMFNLSFQDDFIRREVRNLMVDEIMYQLAILLPNEYRGYYSDLSNLSTKFINFV